MADSEVIGSGSRTGDAGDNPVIEAARRARQAAVALRAADTATKDSALRAIATHLEKDRTAIVSANEQDVTAARDRGTPTGLVDRLTLTHDRLTAIIEAIATVVELPDPVGQVVRGYVLPNGLKVEQVRVPMGVVGMIYEARPNVTVDAATLCLKSGNTALLRGSSSARRSNAALISSMREALVEQGLPADAIQGVPGTGHETVDELIEARGWVDVVIPRGGADLINRVVDGAKVPVIETGIGNCHVYVDAAADPDMAVDIVVNAKTQRPSVCNAAETLLVHQDLAVSVFPRIASALRERGVTLHADPAAAAALQRAGIESVPATDHDWAAEYYSLDLAVGLVPDIEAAMQHVRTWSTGHTEAIVSDSATAIGRFLAGVDSAAIAVNASTRFTDGAELGFGAEIGISTQKLHARGPMALPELTTTTFVLTGTGHVRA